jgi:hypothetical protein
MRKIDLLAELCPHERQRMNRDSSYPRFLYKYRRTTVQHLEPLLLESTFYLSSREQFNDPFDAQCIVTVNGNLRERATRLKSMKRNARAGGANMSLGVKHRRDLHRDMLDRERAQLQTQRAYDKNANEYGIYAMAETPRSLLMWAHYAESHTGVCLGFYVPADPDVFVHALRFVTATHIRRLNGRTSIDRTRSSPYFPKAKNGNTSKSAEYCKRTAPAKSFRSPKLRWPRSSLELVARTKVNIL